MASSYELNITQGSSFNVRLTTKDSDGNPINLSGYHVSGYIRNKYSDTSYLLNLEPTIVSGHAADHDPNDPLKTDAIHSGLIDVNLKPASTASLPITQALYDIEIYTNTKNEFLTEQSSVFKILNGKANIHPEATY